MHIHFWEMRDVTTTKTTKKTNQQTNKIIVDFVIYHALPFWCPRPSMCAAYVLCVGGRWFYCIHIERVCLSCNFIHSCWWKPGWVFANFTFKSVNTQKSVVLKITCMSNHTNIEHVCNIIVSVSVWHWMAWLGMHRWACGATHVKLAVSISLHMCMLSCCWLYGTFGTRSKCNRPAHSQFVHHPVWVSEKTNYFNHFYLYFCHSVSEWTKRKSNWQMSSKRIKFGFVCPFYANACVQCARYRKKRTESTYIAYIAHTRKLMFRQCKGHSCNQ